MFASEQVEILVISIKRKHIGGSHLTQTLCGSSQCVSRSVSSSDPFSIHFEQRCFSGVDPDLAEGTLRRLIGWRGHRYETWGFFACLHRGRRDLRIGLEECIDNERIVKGAPTLK